MKTKVKNLTAMPVSGKIFNQGGKQVGDMVLEQEQFGLSVGTIDFRNLESGTYILNLALKDGQIIRKKYVKE
jgi:hypothetical protein